MKTKEKDFFIFFNIAFLGILLSLLIMIPLYVNWAHNYNLQFTENTPEALKSRVDASQSYLISFLLIYVSLFLVWITQVFILLRNKNGILKSLFPILFWKKNNIILHNENKVKERNNLILSLIIFSLSIIAIWLSVSFNFVPLAFFVYFSFFIVIGVQYFYCWFKFINILRAK
nr:hypothetical protein [Mycoplasmopsis canis]WQQ12120.1 hypothetical protein RRG48_01840 [Mycoplasmopsis canis]